MVKLRIPTDGGDDMAKERIPTDTLLRRLFKTTSLNLFVKNLEENGLNAPPFHLYIKRLCEEKELTPEQVIKKAEIERTHGHKFFNGTRNPSRDKVIQLAFGLALDCAGTQKLLTLAKRGALYPKIKRDAAIIYALERKLDFTKVQELLFDLQLPLLGAER
jgi:transcriptional regulator with XRE-family HTH domain